jgi:uncharacterized protein (DUF885 family)
MVRTVWRVLRWPLLAIVLAGVYGGYRLLFGQPFTINQLANRQALQLVAGEPELLTQVGLVDGTLLDRHSGRLAPVGVAMRDLRYERAERFLRELERFDRASLSHDDQITWDVLKDLYGSDAELRRFEYLTSEGLYPVNPLDGVNVGIIDLLQSVHGLQSPKGVRNYVSRLQAVGAKLDGAIAEMRRQASLGVVLPVSLIDRCIEQSRAVIAAEPAQSPLVRRVTDETGGSGLSDAERRELAAAAEAAVRDVVRPAYQRLVDALESLRPQAVGRGDGIGGLPDGAALYAALLRSNTTTDLSADQIHQIGLDEVARLTTQVEAIFEAQGMTDGTLGGRFEALNRRADQLFPDDDAGREQILARYREILAEVEALMPRYFGILPKGAVEVARVPEATQAGAPGAYYMGAALDGSRPGRFYANLRDVRETPRYTMKTLAYHEGVPGHHFQVDAAQHLDGLPLLRQQTLYTAYAEGWGLYAERLAADIGLYEGDPLGDLGRLQSELFRAVRLVVDTGLHAKGWSREQAIRYMVDNTGLAETEVTAEIERYMSDPGQACAYKIGQLKILELREKAKAALGDGFDLKAFHDVVLGDSAVPLTVLERLVDEWIARGQAAR